MNSSFSIPSKMYGISVISHGKYFGMVSNKSVSVFKMSMAGITKIGIRKSIENNIENLLFSSIKWYVLAFNSMLSVFISSLKGCRI